MVRTRLSLFCDRIIEAGWLAAAIVTPLFFNFYSNRVFEANKVTLLRSIALVMAAAWIIKVTEVGGWKKVDRPRFTFHVSRFTLLVSGIWDRISKTPLVLPTLLFAAIYLLSTLSSVIFRVSFWGSYHRRQGLYVTLCYIVIFFSTLKTLRTRQQLERLITTILLTSLPVSLYGIMQRLQLDPLPWVQGGAGRAQSTLGNPILIGAYLIMVVPLTIRELIRSFSLVRDGKKRTVSSFVLLSCYFLLLALQLVCLLFTVSRGPLIGLMAGVLFFFLLLAVSKGWKGLALTAIGLAIGLGLFLIALNLPNTLLSPVKKVTFLAPALGRLSQISAHIIERTVIWEGAVEMITADPLRAVVGRGPETMGTTFYPYLPPEWFGIAGPDRTADRCHNETLDVWITGGLIGFAAYLFLFGSIYYYGLKWLGLIANSRQRNFLIIIWLVGGFSGLLIPWLMDGTLRWAGVGIPAGILLALVIYLMTTLFLQRKEESPKPKNQSPEFENQILLITLLSALIAHFVEIQFGIAITATRTYFWLYAALLAIVGYHWQQRPEPACPERSRRVEGEEPILEAAAETLPPDSSSQRRGRRRRRRGKLPTSNFKLPNFELLAHSLLVGLILATTSFDLITHQFELRVNGPVIFGLLFVIWLLCGILTLTSNFQLSTSNFSTYVLGSLFCFLPFIVAHAAVVLPGAGVERAIAIYYVYIFLVVLAVAVALMMGSVQSLKLKAQTSNFQPPSFDLQPPTSNLQLPIWVSRFGFLLLSFLVLLLIFNTNLKVAQADIYYKFGLSAEETGEMDKAVALYRRAIQLTPHWDQYYASLGWAYGLKAVATSDANQRVALFEEGRKALEHARQMSPFDPDITLKLGYTYWNWGVLTPDLEQRTEKLEVALAHYQQTVTLNPLWDKFYEEVPGWALGRGQFLKDRILETHLYLGTAYTSLGKLSRAVEVYKRASEMAPDNYDSHKNLTVVYLQLGRLDEALEEAKVARDLAPDEEKPKLDDLIAQLEAQKP